MQLSMRAPIPCCSTFVSPRSARARHLPTALLALAALALGAGCDDEDNLTLRDPSGIGGGGGASEAGGAGTGGDEPGSDTCADSSTSADGGVGAGSITPEVLERDVLATSVLGILTRDCGPCHAGSERAGGVGSIDDVGALVSSGLIVPGNVAQSPLFDSIRSGRMPPAGMLLRPTVGEQWLLEGFIEGLSVDAAECELPPFPSVDEAYAAMLADVTAQPDADRPFIRYVSLTDSAGEACGEPFQARRYALFEAVNGVSLDPEIHVPVAIDAAELLYRLDIRDYDWDRPLDLDADGSDDHPDGWLALVAAAGPYAVELQGPEADALRAATGAAVSVLPSSALVWAASSGDVYYALIGARANIYDTQVTLGIERFASFDAGLVRRAGFWRAADRTEIIVERLPQSASGRSYWSFEPQENDDSGSIYDSPDQNDRVAGQSIWQLPNGLLAYSIEDEGGARLTGPPEPCAQCGVDLKTIYPVGGNPAGCHACHHRGFAPVLDGVLAVVQQNVRDYSPETVEAFAEIFSASDFGAQIAADNAVYLAALARMGVSPSLRSPLSRAFLSFERAPLGIRRVAAELGATPAAVRESLAQLPPGFGGLAECGASISRAAMTEGLRAARCALSGHARNRPIDCPSGS